MSKRDTLFLFLFRLFTVAKWLGIIILGLFVYKLIIISLYGLRLF